MGTSAVTNWPRGFFAALVLLAVACNALAEPVKITFLPPPMEGTLSVGVYDASGKLVRVLHREVEPGELTKGDDGLETQWDGKDNQGKPCPPGTYRARGVLVGDLGVDGVDFIGNDWVSNDDSPHLSRITDLAISASGTRFIEAALPGRSDLAYYFILLKPSATPGEDSEVQLVAEPQAPPIRADKSRPPEFLNSDFWTYGSKGTIWALEEKAVKQYSKTGKVLRTLLPEEGNPPPTQFATSPSDEKLYIRYENATLQRLRGYDFTGVKPGGEPKVLFEQDIHASDTYAQIASELEFPDGKPFVPSPTLTVALMPNPLAHNKPGTLQIRAGVDKEGSYLATADGLPLSHISDTKFLRWAVMGRPAGGDAITLFESDGAVVEQFQIAKIANMMAFDAGAIQWPGEAATPTPSPSPSATPTATPTAPPPR